jgi:hypothetical protein
LVIQPTVSLGRLPLTGRRRVLFVIESTTRSPLPASAARRSLSAREASSGGDVVLDVVFEAGFFHLELVNLGRRPALNVSCRFEKPPRPSVSTIGTADATRRRSNTTSRSTETSCTSLRDSQAPTVSNAAGAERVER